MSRAQRLLHLIQLLRSHRFPVPGAQLAYTLGISLRSLYRDIATLQEQGARIEAAPGLGYVLLPGFVLPPLMFSEEEVEALVLGSRWVAQRADQPLSESAKSALFKIAAVLPTHLRQALEANALLVPSASPESAEKIDLSTLRQAIRHERKVTLHYRDLTNNESHRVIWPFVLGYFDHMRILGAWCELREEFRHFRTDRILACRIEDQRYPRRRQSLMKTWRDMNNIGPQ